jgi:imidazolonepropionase-like amidohydrolase
MKWLVGGQVYDVIEGLFREQSVCVRDGVIEDLTPAVAPGPGDDVVNLRGAYLLPGLIDCHVHLTLNPDASDPSVYGGRDEERIFADTRAAARATLLGGITTVRDCGGWDYLEMRVREQVRSGEALGPRMVLAGKLIWVQTPGAVDYPGMFEIARQPDELRAAATRQLERGADFIKVMATGMTLSPQGETAHDNFYTADELRPLVEFAHEKEVKVACHAEGLDGIRAVVAAGVDSVEHGTHADENVLKIMADHGVFLVPTCMAMAAYLDEAELRATAPDYLIERFTAAKPLHSKAVNNAYRLDVPIAMGTDAGAPGVFHGRNAEEVGRMVHDAGMSVEDALMATTLGAARLLGCDQSVGSLEPGKHADIVAVSENPLKSPTVVDKVSFVMKAGDVVRNDLE